MVVPIAIYEKETWNIRKNHETMIDSRDEISMWNSCI